MSNSASTRSTPETTGVVRIKHNDMRQTSLAFRKAYAAWLERRGLEDNPSDKFAAHRYSGPKY